jgi:hypothetical protein
VITPVTLNQRPLKIHGKQMGVGDRRLDVPFVR